MPTPLASLVRKAKRDIHLIPLLLDRATGGDSAAKKALLLTDFSRALRDADKDFHVFHILMGLHETGNPFAKAQMRDLQEEHFAVLAYFNEVSVGILEALKNVGNEGASKALKELDIQFYEEQALAGNADAASILWIVAKSENIAARRALIKSANKNSSAADYLQKLGLSPPDKGE
jgi:hypothetical protein